MIESQQQLDAKMALDKNVLLSASAGAGKTTVLINRLMKRILDDGINVDQIIAMTFTELAAGEMKKRLAKRLNEAYTEYKKAKNDVLAQRLYQQIALLPNSKISTIHSFCLTLIKDYAYALGINTKRASSILDEASASVYKLQALNKVMDTFYQTQPDGFIDLLSYFKSNPENDEKLRTNIMSLATKLGAKSDPDTWLINMVSSYQNAQKISDLDITYQNAFFDYLAYRVLLIDNTLNLFEKSLLGTGLGTEITKIDLFKDILRSVKSAINSRDYSLYLKHWDRLNTYEHSGKHLKNDTVTNARKDFFESLKPVLSICFEEERFIEDLKQLSKQVVVLKDMTLSYMNVYSEIKKSKEVLDFNDMERMALEILKDEDFKVADTFKAYYKEILIDEFQDTNDVQNEIIELISNGSNTFRVGDIKQSIYRFRNAKPQLMLNMMENPSESDKVLYLSQNYRSSEAIIDFNNFLFNRLMNVPGIQSNYTENDMVTFGIPENKGGKPVEIHLIENGLEDEPKDDEDKSIDDPNDESDSNDETANYFNYKEESKDRIKVRHIAQTILEMKSKTEFKKWKDYVVLVKTHKRKTEFKRIFDEVGIVSFIDVKSGFYNADSVLDMMMLMRLCLNHDDQLSLAGVLLSPLFSLSEDDLAKLSLINKYSLMKALEINLKPIYDQIQALIESSNHLSLVQFLNLAYSVNDYYFSACDTQLRTNLDFLKAKAESFDENSLGLLEFVEMIDMIKGEDTSEAIPISEDDDVVKVMTIHQAKGLEWPVVFVLSNTDDKDHDSNGGSLYYHPDIGIGLSSLIMPDRYLYENPMSLGIKHRNKIESKAEALRTLYVALTRAKSRLIVVDYDAKNLEKKELDLNLLTSSKGSIYWIMAALREHEDKAVVTKIPADKIKNAEVKLKHESKQFSFSLQKSQSMEWKTPSSTHAKIPYFNLKPIDLFSGKERGTRLHSLMELLPISDWNHDLILNIDPLCNSEEIDAVMAFYNSAWYQDKINKQIMKEFPFTYLKSNQVIHGIMDMLVYDDTDVYLLDYKTDVNLSEQGLSDNYKEQLVEYALALQAIFPNHQIHCALYSFKFKKILEY